MFNLISPKNWVGWTAVILVIVLAVVAGLADGTHRFFRMSAWLLVIAVAAVALVNSNKG